MLNHHSIGSGKVREKFSIPGEVMLMLILTTDRISAFDRVIGEIKRKGRILNELAVAWKRFFEHIIINDVVCSDDVAIAKYYGCTSVAPELAGRLCIVKRARVIPIECIVRFSLEGSLDKEYRKVEKTGGMIWGLWFPKGLIKGEILPKPVFTPSTKAETGHDLNISFDEMEKIISTWLKENPQINGLNAKLLCQAIKSTSLALASIGREKMARLGYHLLDTKFEFGLIYDFEEDEYKLCLIDEVLTPDSSRAVSKGRHSDKQILRDWLENGFGWDKESDPPKIPPCIEKEIISGYSAFYQAAITS
jgi:phosphoribosylaminoimidazole-succinocarboxamide synthase